MKNYILSILCLLLSVALFASVGRDLDYYSIIAEVVSVERNADGDIVTLQTPDGNLYDMKSAYFYHVGDLASLVMDSRGTQNLCDDKIKSANIVELDFYRKAGKN